MNISINPPADGFRQMTDHIRMRYRVHGEHTLMAEFLLDRGAELPAHDHPHEQTGYLISGRLRLVIDGTANEMAPGDSWCVAGNTEHSAEALADCRVIEVFSPVRDDYLP